MNVIRRALSVARRMPPGRLVVLVALLLTILAACGPGSGQGPAY